MSEVALVVVLTALGAGGLLLIAAGLVQPVPSLDRVVAHLQRPGPGQTPELRGARTFRAGVARLVAGHPRVLPTKAQLALVGRSPEQHVLWSALAAAAGFVGPAVVVVLLQRTAPIGFGWTLPFVAAIGGAVLGPLLFHAATLERAAAVRTDLRHQTSAYLDVVTMLLAGNTGYEGALEQAAHAGDGRLFVELRRRMRESGTRGVSLTDALHRASSELGLPELEQVAGTAALSASEGAPVARTLAAKCATLRSALTTEQETEARLRTSRLTTPIVGMALVFMGLVIYPALSFS